MVLTQTHGIVSVLLNHTRTRGPSVASLKIEISDFAQIRQKKHAGKCTHQIYDIQVAQEITKQHVNM